MKTHFVGFSAFRYSDHEYEEIFLNLSKIGSVAPCSYKEGHSLITMTDETACLVMGSPREILNALYDRVPRDSISVTYAKEEVSCSNI